MIADRFQRDDQFAFPNPRSRANHGGNCFDADDYVAWAERIKSKRGGYFGRPSDQRVGAWTRRASFGNDRYCKKCGGEEEEITRAAAGEEDRDSGGSTSSPPLWDNSKPAGDKATARAREIARYRQQMLDLVRGMPESEYELSLRDLVESPEQSTETPNAQASVEEERGLLKEQVRTVKRNPKARNKRMARSDSMQSDGGFLLKMFFPFSLGQRKPKANPRTVEQGKGGSDLGGVGSSSTSSNSSSSSSSSAASSKIKRVSSCYSFFRMNTDRDKEI